MKEQTPVNFKKLQRAENWPSLLADYLWEHRETEFVWGEHDCCLFAANWVKLCLGEDPAKEYRGTYQSQWEGERLLKKHHGVMGLAGAKFQRVRLSFAQRGDLVVLKDPNLKGPAWAVNALGILDGRFGLFAGLDGGLRVIHRPELMKTAFAVGDRKRRLRGEG